MIVSFHAGKILPQVVWDYFSSIRICSNCSICLECFNDYMSQPIDFDCFCGCQKKVKSFEKNILSEFIKHYIQVDIMDIINKQHQVYKDSLIPLISQEDSLVVENKVLEIRNNPSKYPEHKIEDYQKLTGCLNCGYLIFKEEGCDAMICHNCSSNFCAECMVQRKNFPCKCASSDPSHFSNKKISTYNYYEDIVVFPVNVIQLDYLRILNNLQYNEYN